MAGPAGNAMEFMADFGLDTSGAIQGLSELALAFDVDFMAIMVLIQAVEGAFNDTIGAAVEFGTTMQNQANILNVSVENVQQLRNAAIATDTDFQSASNAVRMFSQKLEESGTAGDTLRKGITDMGISLTDTNGNMKSSTDLFIEINQHLADMPDGYERNNEALKLYGRGWTSVANMITNADEATTAYGQTSGLVHSDMTKESENMTIKYNQLMESIASVGREIGDDLYPVLTTLLDAFQSFPIDGGDFKKGMDVIDIALIATIDDIAALVNGLDAVGAAMHGDFESAGKYASAMEGNLKDEMTKVWGLETDIMSDGTKKTDATATPKTALGTNADGTPIVAKSGGTDSDNVQGKLNGMTATQLVAAGYTQDDIDYAYKNGNISAQQYDNIETSFVEASKAAASAAILNTANPYYQSGAIENQTAQTAAEHAQSEMQYQGSIADISQTSSGQMYAKAGNIWNLASKEDQSNSYIKQIMGVEGLANSIDTAFDGQATWMNTSDNQYIAKTTIDAWDTYQSQKQASAGIVQINYISGGSAEEVANAIAEATSRVLAKQVTSQ